MRPSLCSMSNTKVTNADSIIIDFRIICQGLQCFSINELYLVSEYRLTKLLNIISG